MRPGAVSITPPASGRRFAICSGLYTVLVSGDQTEDAYAVIEMLVPPGGGPGPHAHAGMEESFYVQEGAVVFRSETQQQAATAGTFVTIPKGGAIHCFKNESDSNARLLCIVRPAGLERFFAEVGIPVADNATLPAPAPAPDAAVRMMEVGKAYGQEFFPPGYLDR